MTKLIRPVGVTKRDQAYANRKSPKRWQANPRLVALGNRIVWVNDNIYDDEQSEDLSPHYGERKTAHDLTRKDLVIPHVKTKGWLKL